MATKIISRLLPKSLSLATTTSRGFSTTTTSTPPSSALSFLRRLCPHSGAVNTPRRALLLPHSFRSLSNLATPSWFNDPDPNPTISDIRETVLRNECDFLHWLVVMDKKPKGVRTRDEIIHSYTKTLAEVIGNEDDARTLIYSVSNRHYYAFGALVTEKLAYQITKLPGVRWVLPDSYVQADPRVFECFAPKKANLKKRYTWPPTKAFFQIKTKQTRDMWEEELFK